MICQRCGQEFTDDGVTRIVRIAGLYAYQDERFELCPTCLSQIDILLRDPDAFPAKRYTDLIYNGGKVTSRVSGIEQLY